MDDSDRRAPLRDRVGALRRRLFPELLLSPPQRDGRSRKRRLDTSESSVSRKSSRADAQRRREPPLDAQYFTRIQSRRDYHATDCVERLGRELDVRSETDFCTGTLIRRFQIDEHLAESAWKRMKGEWDIGWSDVALQEGVKLARSGKYSEALESYNQALKLNPDSCDAYVARGAAYANQGFYDEALNDFEKALDLNPTDKNAIEYRQRIERRKLERRDRAKPTVPQPTGQLQYREGLFGRGMPLASKQRAPDDEDIQTAIEVLTRHREEKHKRRHRKRRK